MSEFIPEEVGPTITDEEVREVVTAGTYAYLRSEGQDALGAIYRTALMGQAFDHWLARRDTEIFGEGCDAGYGEGYYDGYAEGYADGGEAA